MNPKSPRNFLNLLYLELIVIIAIVGTYGWVTYERNLVWKTEYSLWTDVVKKSSNKARPYRCLGTFFYKQKGLIDEAITCYKISLRLNPFCADAYNNLGICYFNKGLIDEAIAEFEYAIRINPDHVNAHYNLGVVYSKKGLSHEAIKEFKEALRINPDDFQARERLARLRAKGE